MKASRSLRAILFCTLFLFAASTALAQNVKPSSQDQFLVYIGTYTGAKSKGIYVSRLDAATGKLTAPELAAEIASPSFLAVHPTHRFLYSVNEAGDGKTKGV